jgi:hypothetical protein
LKFCLYVVQDLRYACRSSSTVVLEDMVLVSRRPKDLKKGLSLGLGLVSKFLGLGLGLDKIVLVLKKGLVDSTASMCKICARTDNVLAQKRPLGGGSSLFLRNRPKDVLNYYLYCCNPTLQLLCYYAAVQH